MGSGKPCHRNPPYVSIGQLSESEKARYRRRFSTASGRFDLYTLFFEQSLRSLAEGGRLVLITPEKFLTVGAARPLRQLLSSVAVHDVFLLPEDTFRGVVTYPAVAVLSNAAPGGMPALRLHTRRGEILDALFTGDGRPLVPTPAAGAGELGGRDGRALHTLDTLARRISCGVATGADRVFVLPGQHLPEALKPFAHPTLSGRQLGTASLTAPPDVMLIPYSTESRLLHEAALGDLGTYLSTPERRYRLLQRACAKRKPWYAFHETPPLDDIKRPKLLCKDISGEPRFFVDRSGHIVPRHSVYYIVPHDPAHLDPLASWLNKPEMGAWLKAHAQPAANGFRRIQSTLLKRAPAPPSLQPAPQPSLFAVEA